MSDGWEKLSENWEHSENPLKTGFSQDEYVPGASSEDEEEEPEPEPERKKFSFKPVGKPFAGYEDFGACVADNQDKSDPEAYCAHIMAVVEGLDDVNKASGSDIKDAFLSVINNFFANSVPSRDELQELVSEVQNELKAAFDSVVDRLFRSVYDESVQEVEREMDMNFTFGAPDREALRALKNSPVLSESFAGLQNDVVDKIHDIMNEAYANPEELTTEKIRDRIEEVADVAAHRAETIARTESSKVSAAARRASYEKEGELGDAVFEWIGPNDNRTTDSCKRIMRRTSGGVPYEKLINIIQEEVRRDFPKWTVDPNAPLAHYNCRHTFVKVT